MYSTVSGEAVFFLCSVLTGILTMLLYDILRISRRIVKVGTSVVTIEDILFFVVAALMLFYVAYLKNSGEIRWQGFIGGALGAGIYFAVIRNRVVDAGTTLVRWVMRAFVGAVRICLFPVKIIFKALRKPIAVVAWYTSRGFRRAKRLARQAKIISGIRAKSAFMMLRKK